jgi:hypothetical protein
MAMWPRIIKPKCDAFILTEPTAAGFIRTVISFWQLLFDVNPKKTGIHAD